MAFESMPKPEKPGDGLIRFEKNGVKYSMTPEEYEAHVRAEAIKQQLDKKEEEGKSFQAMIEKLKGTPKPKSEEDESEEEIAA